MKTGNWLEKQVSFYNTHRDNIGRPATYRQVLLCYFGNCIKELNQLRELEKEYDAGLTSDIDYKVKKSEIKSKLPCFAPSALLQSRAAGNVIEIERSAMLQLDFDYVDIQDYDIEELKECVFSFPFIAFCGLSCSGKGFFALALIAEPARLNEYAEHIFNVLMKYGIKPDTSKGRNVNDLRYLSYDGNMLIRQNPEPLKISHFKAKEAPKPIKRNTYPPRTFAGKDGRITKGINDLLNVLPGSRWATVQKVAFTLGGLNDSTLLNEIYQAIESNNSFTGEEKKYLKCADDCFNSGSQNPLL